MNHSKVGKRFGRLIVMSEAEPTYNNKRNERVTRYLCKCDCGNEKIIITGSLSIKNPRTTSCGCFHSDHIKIISRKHGDCIKTTKEYSTYKTMIQRCYNQNSKAYVNYGGRCISVCDRWRNSFENFLEDMGRAPSKNYTLEREDNNGNYSPENCVWATRYAQARNKSVNVFITYNGHKKLRLDWGRLLGYSDTTFRRHLDKYGVDYVFNNAANKLIL